MSIKLYTSLINSYVKQSTKVHEFEPLSSSLEQFVWDEWFNTLLQCSYLLKWLYICKFLESRHILFQWVYTECASYLIFLSFVNGFSIRFDSKFDLRPMNKSFDKVQNIRLTISITMWKISCMTVLSFWKSSLEKGVVCFLGKKSCHLHGFPAYKTMILECAWGF